MSGPTPAAAGGAGVLAAGASLGLAAIFMSVAMIAGVAGSSLGTGTSGAAAEAGAGVSALARREIPAEYLRLYEAAARRYGLDWAVLAGIGKVECDHGLDPDPSCTHPGVVNSAGAGGPMQFLASTWATYGVDGDGDGRIERWDPADAIFSAANYLRASGAPGDYRAAIFAYNHAGWYVEEVERWAAKYRGTAGAGPSLLTVEAGEGEAAGADVALRGASPTPVRFIAGQRAMLAPGDGHLALVPVGVPATVQAMIVAGNELQELPYGPGGHPDPRAAREEDCSSTVNYVLYRAGVQVDRGNHQGQPARAGLCRLGSTGSRALGDDLRDDRAHRSCLHCDRRPASGHQPQRYRCRAESRRRRPALADSRPDPDVGPLVGAPSTRAVRWRAWRRVRLTIC